MKKILIFADSFLPGFKGGGPVTSVFNLVGLLNKDFEVLVCTKNHDFGETEPYRNIISDKPTVYKELNIIYLSSMDKDSITKVVNEFTPNLIYLNSFFSKTTQIVMLLNKYRFKKKLVVAPRGELQKNALKIKQTKKFIYLLIYKFLGFYKNISFHSTDRIESDSIKNMFDINNITELQNAVKIHNFDPLQKKENELKIVFISRISRKKNLHFALKLLNNISFNITFDIYGPKEDAAYWKECQKIIENLPKNIKVVYKGSLAQDEIVDKMREYHAFLFPTLSENFGHVIVESMQAGLVPIISDQTPWIDLKPINAGWDIKLEDKNSYIQAIEDLYLMDNKEYTKKSYAIMNYIHNQLDMKKLANEYIAFFNKTIGEEINV